MSDERNDAFRELIRCESTLEQASRCIVQSTALGLDFKSRYAHASKGAEYLRKAHRALDEYFRRVHSDDAETEQEQAA